MNVLAYACIIAAFCVAATLQDTLPSSPCDDGPLPAALRVEGCERPPCNIIKGTDMNAQWDFLVNANTKSLKPRVRVKIMGVTINYPYPEQDACKSLTNGKCPLKKDEKVTYNLKMPISNKYPSVSMNIEFSLIDENNNVQVCFKLDCKVTNK